MNTEAQALSSEYTRVIQTTAFNGRNLLSGSFGELRLQAGFGVTGGIQAGLGGAVGTGTFTAVVLTADPGYTTVTGDFDNDGNQDYVTARSDAEDGSVSLGNGSGGFGTRLLVTGVTYGVTADFTGDGVLDLVVGNQFHRGLGDGTFSTRATISGVASLQYGLAAADFDGDGISDLIATSEVGVLTVYRGLGTGQFTSAFAVGLGQPVSGIATGDVNRDGRLDFAYMVYDGQIGVLSGDGIFGFSALPSYFDPDVNQKIQLADLNQDNLLDLVSSVDGATQVRLGRGDGTFSDPTSYAFGGQGFHVQDMNGDGYPDYVAAYEGTVVFAAGTGMGTFGDAVTSQSPGGANLSSSNLITADFNNDGVPDVGTGWNYSVPNGTGYIWLQDTTSGTSPLLPFDLSTAAGARQALPVLARAGEQVSKQRGSIGAFQSRIDSAIRALRATADAYAEASSRIGDADVAAESAELARVRILQEASAAVLAQANLQPQLALQLLSS